MAVRRPRHKQRKLNAGGGGGRGGGYSGPIPELVQATFCHPILELTPQIPPSIDTIEADLRMFKLTDLTFLYFLVAITGFLSLDKIFQQTGQFREKLYPILDPNALIYIPYPRVNCLKAIPFTAAHTYIAHIWRYPPPPGLNDHVYSFLWFVSSRPHYQAEF